MRWVTLLLLLAPAWAHRPAEDLGGTFEIEDPTISYILVSELETPNDVGIVRLSFDQPFAAPFEVMVPGIPRLADHRPAYAVVGEGLPEPDADTLARLPKRIPEGHGVFVDFNDRPERLVYFEQVMRRTLFTSGSIALPVQGDVEVWVWTEDGSTGPWWFAFGVEEDFSDGGFADVFAEWSKYAY